MRRIDINTDTGESFGRWELGDDLSLLDWVSSANIACGMHAGDPLVMDGTVAACVERGVATGAHPGFPDIQGFGRREMRMSPSEVEVFVMYQIGALKPFVESRGMSVSHVKPHGALYSASCVDDAIALAVARGVARSRAKGDNPVLVGIPGSKLLWAGEKVGIPTAAEGFCDRAYGSDGSLVPRSVPGSVITDTARVAERAVSMVRDGRLETVDGGTLELKVDTICIHGDTPGAAGLARAVASALAAAGIRVTPLRETLGL